MNSQAQASEALLSLDSIPTTLVVGHCKGEYILEAILVTFVEIAITKLHALHIRTAELNTIEVVCSNAKFWLREGLVWKRQREVDLGHDGYVSKKQLKMQKVRLRSLYFFDAIKLCGAFQLCDAT